MRFHTMYLRNTNSYCVSTKIHMCNGSEKWCLPLDDSPPISRAYPFWVDVIHNLPVDICKLSSRGPINIHLTTFLLKILELPAEAEPENRFEPIFWILRREWSAHRLLRWIFSNLTDDLFIHLVLNHKTVSPLFVSRFSWFTICRYSMYLPYIWLKLIIKLGKSSILRAFWDRTNPVERDAPVVVASFLHLLWLSPPIYLLARWPVYTTLGQLKDQC